MATNLQQSPITKMTQRYKDHDYPLVFRLINRHLVVTSPDFKFPIPIVIPFDPPHPDLCGKALYAAWLQVADYLRHLDDQKLPHPTPKPNEIFPKLLDAISIKEACRILGMKQTMLRELSDQGEIPCTHTPKGHRRYSREKLEQYIQKKILPIQE